MTARGAYWPMAMVAIAAAASGYLVVTTSSQRAAALVGGLGVVATSVLLVGHRDGSRRVPVAADRTPLLVARGLFFGGLVLVGQLTVRPAFGTTASDYLFMAALVLALAGIVALGTAGGYMPIELVTGAAFFACGAFVSDFSAGLSVASLGASARFLYLSLVWIWLATVLLRSMRDIRIGTALWVISIGVSGAAAALQLIAGDIVPGTEIAYGRMTGTAQHVNDLGGSAAVALPAAVGLMLQHSAARLVLVGYVGTALITTALVLSGSVGGMLAAALGIAVTALVTKRLRSLGLGAGLIALAGLATMHFQSAEDVGTLSDRLTVVGGPTGTLADRVEVFALAWERIANNPFVGVGIGVDPRVPTGDLPDLVHNAFLGVWYHGGVLALAGLVIISVTALHIGLKAQGTAEESEDRALIGALVGSFAAYLAFGLGAPTLYARYGWVPVALLVAARAVQLHARKATTRAG